MTDPRELIEAADKALEGATEGRWVRFHPRYCPEAEGTPFSDWDSSHDMSAIRADDGTRYKLATFRHASDAFFAQEARRLLPAMRDALRAAVEPAVRVKPLVWDDSHVWRRAETSIGVYAIAVVGEEEDLYCLIDVLDGRLTYPTLEAAKAAAQADYEARILSALDTAPEGQP